MRLKETKEQVTPNTTIVRSGAGGNPRNRILIGTATLGVIRMEWAAVRWGQTIPCNWSAGHAYCGIGQNIPMHYLVADAQNIITEEAITKNFEWVLLWEDDVIPPVDLFCQLDPYMRKGTIPVVSGLYYLKSIRPEPILYRGRGNRYFDDFKLGDKVWVDATGTGCLLIHTSILKLMWEESEEYVNLGGKKTRRVFETASKWLNHPHGKVPYGGTSDIVWCDRVIKEDVLRRAGWPRIAKKQYPFLCDTNIFCRHINLTTGQQYPLVMPKTREKKCR